MKMWNGRKVILMFVLLGFALQTPIEAAQLAFVANNDDDNVSVIDTVTNTVRTTIMVGDGPIGITVAPNGLKVYVTNIRSDDVSVIQTSTYYSVISTIPVGNAPYGVAVTPDGTKVYVANHSGNTVSVIDTDSNAVVNEITVGDSPAGVAIAPDGTSVYVSIEDGNYVSVIDTATDTVATDIPVGNEPFGLAVTPDGTKVYVASSPIAVIDTYTNTVSKTIPCYRGRGVAISPNSSVAYVVDQGNEWIRVIDTATNVVTDDLPGSGAFGIAVAPDGTAVYVANSNENKVWVIDASTNSIATTIAVGAQPYSLGQFISDDVSDVVIGSISGVNPTKVVCRNLHTRQTVIIDNGSTSFDCKQAGLEVNIGDRVDIIIKGNGN